MPATTAAILLSELVVASEHPLPWRTEKQIASDENQYLRRRLEAIERTALKLNLGGPSAEIQGLKERLELESAEVLRLRETVYALKADKIAMADVR